MVKRGRIEIVKDMLSIINDNKNSIKKTPLIRRSNLSSVRFKEHYSDLLLKDLVKEKNHNGKRMITLTDKGKRFLEKYKTIVNFIEEFDL